MSVTERPFSDLLRHPNEVASALDTYSRVVIRRRNAPDLELTRADTRASDLSQAECFARILAGLLPHVAIEKVPAVVAEVLPWTKHLTGEGRAHLVAGLPDAISDCSELGTLAPLDTYLAEWRATAAIYADPDLRDRLSGPIEEPLDRLVPAP